MRRLHDPVNARAARTTLRAYALGLPVLSLAGGWCTLLQIASLISPDIIAHIPESVRLITFFGSIFWVTFLLHAFRRLPGVIDDILARGLVMDDSQTQNISRLQSVGRLRSASHSYHETTRPSNQSIK